jgi:hypothetical protein
MTVNEAKLINVTQLVSLQPMPPESNKMLTNQVNHALEDFTSSKHALEDLARSNANMY